MARARDLVVAAWRASPKRWAENFLNGRLLKADGGSVDALVAIHAADLTPNGHTHLLIARELEAAGRTIEAQGWAGEGRRPAPEGPVGRLGAGRRAQGCRAGDEPGSPS